MRWMLKTLGILALCFMAGCAWTGKKESPAVGKAIRIDTLPKAVFVERGKIVDAKLLRRGGKLLIVPFTAGEGVAATAELDKITLMLVKGTAETLEREGAYFQILTNANAQEADFILKGHIVDLGKTASFKRLFFQSQRSFLGVEGQILDASSKETILLFRHHKKAWAGEKDDRELGYAVGEDIARFILSADNR